MSTSSRRTVKRRSGSNLRSSSRNYELSDQDLSRVLQLVTEHEQEIRDAWHQHFDS